MRAFNFGKTIHAQPLTEQGRENWERAFGKEAKKTDAIAEKSEGNENRN